MHPAQLRKYLFTRHKAAPRRNSPGPVTATKDANMRRPSDRCCVTRYPFVFALRPCPKCVPYRRLAPHRPRMIKVSLRHIEFGHSADTDSSVMEIDMKKPRKLLLYRAYLVAGVGFEPTTSRL